MNCGHFYCQSKLLAERKAWEIAKKYDLNVTTICPGLILGELIINRFTPSMGILNLIMKSPIYMDLNLRIVSAYDVALAHVRSLERADLTKN